MTSTASATSSRNSGGAATTARSAGAAAPRRRRAFTLIELLVVIGILALLTTVLLPILVKVTQQSRRYKIGMLMNTISQALEAYKGDFADYPRLPPGEQNDAFCLLGTALMGPGPQTNVLTTGTLATAETQYIEAIPQYVATASYAPGTVVYQLNSGTASFYACTNEMGSQGAALPATTTNIPPDEHWSYFPQWADGADGPGFRNRPGGNGRTWGPYIQADRVKMVGAAIVDTYNHPVLYYVRNAANANINAYQQQTSSNVPPAGGGYIAAWTPGNGYPPPMYNFNDNGQFCRQDLPGSTVTTPDPLPLQALMGSSFTSLQGGTMSSNYIHTDLGETPRWVGPYILWSPGINERGIYGPNWNSTGVTFNDPASYTTDAVLLKRAVEKCENVFNFSFAQ